MIAVNIDRVTFTYGSTPILNQVSWQIPDDHCIGLVGANGSGKSTLFRLISGEITSDEGTITRRQGLQIGYLPQDIEFQSDQSLLEVVLSASEELSHVEGELARLDEQFADPEVYGDERALTRLVERQEKLLEKYTRLGGPGFEGQVRSILANLGFNDTQFNLPVEALSGGQRKLLGLARLQVMKPDLLLLDEPDNHLDLEGKTYLEKYIRSFPGAVILVSHDRYLLDLIVEEIVEVEDGQLTHYTGNYSEYAFEKNLHLLRQQQIFQAQQKEITRLEQSAKRLMIWGSVYDNEKFIRRGQNILKRLERMDRVEQPILERKTMALQLKGWRGSNKVLEISNLGKVFPPTTEEGDEEPLLAGVNLLIWHGERVGLIGQNGSGKSMLFKIILDEEKPSKGQIKIGPSIRIGYYAQHHETLGYESTLIDTIRQSAALSESQAVAFLGRFLFRYEQQRGAVKYLSGGERSRLQLALLMLSSANFLLLDEPTNNLDIASIEVLESALSEFEGSLLVISHDRYFLDRVADRVVAIEEGILKNYQGGYSDYIAEKHSF